MTDFHSSPRRTNTSRIAEARIAAGLTQAQLAAKSGVPMRSISRWETGQASPPAHRLKAIADALGVPLESIL